jgi:hypothetical protein
MKLRQFCYIYNSRKDFIDLWLCIYLLMTGIVCVFHEDKGLIYSDIETNISVSQYQFGILAIMLSFVNLIRLFLNFKLPDSVILFTKCLTLAFFCFCFLKVVSTLSLPLTASYLLIVILLSLDNIRRT